jgi:hypothetical protein
MINRSLHLLVKVRGVRTILTSAMLVLLLGCAHDRQDGTAVRVTRPATEADAAAVAAGSVRAKENWKQVGSSVNKMTSGWRVLVAKVPSNFGTPYVLVTIDEAGHVTSYRRSTFGM